MKLHMIAAALALPLLTLLAPVPAVSQVGVEFGIRIGPPPPRHEAALHPPFMHAVWIGGHWTWNAYDGRYVWVRGHWVERRPAYTWVDGQWYRGPRGWFWREGGWRHNGHGQMSREVVRVRENQDHHPGPTRGHNGHFGKGQTRGSGRRRG
jgi:hypothetical protein